MTTSGVSNWNPVLLEIIKQMLLNVGAIQEGEEPSAAMYESGVFQLNAMVKSIEAAGAHVWTEEEGILFLEPFQARYVIGAPAPTANAHTSDAEDWIRVTLTAPSALGASHIQVSTADGLLLLAGMNIGVVDNDNLTEWFEVSGTPVAGLVQLSGALLVGADVGNYALAYTDDIVRPLKVPRCRLLTLQSLTTTPMTVLSRQEYEDLPNKGGAPGSGGNGVPTQFFYSPRRDRGLLYVWPTPNFSNWAVRLTWYRPLQDYLIPTNTSDFPQEWVNPLIWNLSKETAPGYGVPEPTWQRIVTMADTYAMMVVDYDRESEPIQFGMDWPTGAPG